MGWEKERRVMVLSAAAAALSLCAAALMALYPPPGTFARLFPVRDARVLRGGFAAPVCNGIQCRLCSLECFLPEGARGRCGARINHAGSIKTIAYSGTAAAASNTQ